jgi:phosphohistidine swiveling domain-containing protein
MTAVTIRQSAKDLPVTVLARARNRFDTKNAEHDLQFMKTGRPGSVFGQAQGPVASHPTGPIQSNQSVPEGLRPSFMRWRGVAEFGDSSVPKLANLRRARDCGLAVPEPTLWAPADELERATELTFTELTGVMPLPCVARSGSPTEDTAEMSGAGRFVSLEVDRPNRFEAAIREVIAALPKRGGVREGVVFIQPRIDAARAGVTFFDGFYYEETSAERCNTKLTAGIERGSVVRGHLQRADARSAWLQAVHGVFGGRLDLEWAERSDDTRILLQARPAIFPVRRNETLSLANHKEILGDPPSPWMVGVFVAAGRSVLDHFATVEPAVATWDETYSVELAERVWMNFSVFFRLMDEWGLPRTMVSEGVGGDATGPADRGVRLGRLLRKLPTLAHVAIHNLLTAARSDARLRELDTAITAADDLLALQDVTVRAQAMSIRTNIAIMQILAVATKVRRLFGFEQAARVVTQAMMDEYAHLAAEPDTSLRLRRLDEWLVRYGHRGPLETDLSRPRFVELRAELRADLARGPAPEPEHRTRPRGLRALVARPLFLADEWRERFRDRLMVRWQTLRARILEQARHAVDSGHLQSADDVFWLRSQDLAADACTWRARAAHRRRRWERTQLLHLPDTATRDEITALVRRHRRPTEPARTNLFPGIGLGSATITGTAVRGTDVTGFLNGRALPLDPILVADALEPSWGVLFPRFEAVVADLGGELSHAAILLREAGIPAVVNARGSFAAIADGDRIRVDAERGEVVVVRRARPPRSTRRSASSYLDRRN